MRCEFIIEVSIELTDIISYKKTIKRESFWYSTSSWVSDINRAIGYESIDQAEFVLANILKSLSEPYNEFDRQNPIFEIKKVWR